MLSECLDSASAVKQPPTAIPCTKHGQTKIDHELPLTTTSTRFFITSCTWLRRGALCDRGFTQFERPGWNEASNIIHGTIRFNYRQIFVYVYHILRWFVVRCFKLSYPEIRKCTADHKFEMRCWHICEDMWQSRFQVYLNPFNIQ